MLLERMVGRAGRLLVAHPARATRTLSVGPWTPQLGREGTWMEADSKAAARGLLVIRPFMTTQSRASNLWQILPAGQGEGGAGVRCWLKIQMFRP